MKESSDYQGDGRGVKTERGGKSDRCMLGGTELRDGDGGGRFALVDCEESRKVSCRGRSMQIALDSVVWTSRDSRRRHDDGQDA